MKKSLVLAVAAASVMAFAAPAFAAPANPFADVRADHWAYEAVTGLYKAGIVSGNEGKFMGTNAMTRYEMAQVVYAAMQNMQKATPNQKAAIEKLQKEFASELKSLGARVAKLEAGQKAPSVIVMGQQRFTYAYRNDKNAGGVAAALGFNSGKDNYFTYRTRLEWYAPFGKDFTYYGRLRAQDYDVTRGTTTAGAGSFGQVKMEIHQLTWNNPFDFKNTKVTAGRTGLFLGKGGFAMAVGDMDGVAIDTRIANKINYKLMFTGSGDQTTAAGAFLINQVGYQVNKNFGLTAYNMKKDWSRVASNNKAGIATAGSDFNVWALGVDYRFNKKLAFFGEYAKNTKDITKYAGQTVGSKPFAPLINEAWYPAQKKNPQAYWFGVTNGSTIAHPGMALMVPFAKQGASAFAVIYKNIENGAVNMGTNQLNMTLGNSATNGVAALTDNVKGFEAYYERVIRPNVVFLGQFGSVKPISNQLWSTNYGTGTNNNNGGKVNYAIGQLYLFF